MKLLILGGYGVFGGRLVELLSDVGQLNIIIAGRTRTKAQDFCDRYNGLAAVSPLQLDRSEISERLADLKPDIVIDASGPFQDYGDDPYAVVRACIEHRINYLDFADGADFVAGVSAFDEEARKAGVFVLSGVSSFPVLTAAVLREIAREMDIVSVTGGIAPSPYAGIGLNVMKAVVGYAGGDVKLHRDGKPAIATGLAESRYFTIATPGRLPLRNIRFSLVDVPDLQLIPAEHPNLRDIWIGAGPVPEFLHIALNGLAKLRAALRLPSWAPFAPLFYRVLNRMAFGEHRGGMFIHAAGDKDGEITETSWHLLAEGEDGPYIPSMAIEAVVRKLLDGVAPETGARSATNALTLADYDMLFARKSIFTGFRRLPSTDASVFERLLGEDFINLPKPLQEFHSSRSSQIWSGRASVRRGKGLVARLVGKIMKFPAAAEDVAVSVTRDIEPHRERWTRNFGGSEFSSLLQVGQGRNEALVEERFGPIRIGIALVREEDRLQFIPRHWSFLGIPLPRFLMPGGESFETEQDGRFRFDVEINMPLFGLIASYKGWLVTEHDVDPR